MEQPKVQPVTNFNFNLGLYLSDGWNIFKQGAGSFVGFTILYFVIVTILAFIPVINIASGLVQYLLTAGFYIFCRNLLQKKDDFSQFFQGFNYFLPIFLFFLLLSFLIMPFSYLIINHVFPPGLIQDYMSGKVVPEDFINQIKMTIEGNSNYIILMMSLFSLIVIYLYVSYSFVLPLIVDSGLSFWEAMETSRKTVGAKFFSFLLLYLLIGIIFFIGAIITCGMGLLVVLPFSICVIFSAYDNIFRPQTQESIQDVEFIEIE